MGPTRSHAPSLDFLRSLPKLTVFEMHFGGIRDWPRSRTSHSCGGSASIGGKFDTEDLAVLGEMKKLQALSIGALRNVERQGPLDGKPSGTLRYLTLERLLGLQMFEELGICAAFEDIEARPADRGLGLCCARRR